MTDASSRAGSPTADEVGGYRPYLDGLRAVAVLLVVGFHAGMEWLTGGFIGVDVFFVLSGYLVTRLLIKDVRGVGKIRYPRFYARRFRRLLPAAAVVLIATAIIYPGISKPAELPAAEDAIRSAALYMSNWYFISQANDYFAGNVQANPVLHFWSLSVEEQFYLAWPVLFGGALVVARWLTDRIWLTARIIVVIGLLASLTQALRLQSADLSRAYYGTDARAYQLLAGALLALSPSAVQALRRSTRLAPVLRLGAIGSSGGLLLLATSIIEVGAITRGIATTVLTVALLACMEATGVGLVRSVLSRRPVVYLGRISYGIYLWHWLVILMIIDRFDISPPAVAAVAVLAASGLAALSYHLLEMPVRESRWLDRRRLSVVAVGLVTSALIGVVMAPEILHRDASTASVTVAGGTAVKGGNRIPADLDWRGAAEDHSFFTQCGSATLEMCTLVQGPSGSAHVLLMGDSHASSYIPPLIKLAEERSFTLSAAVLGGCPWQRGILRVGKSKTWDSDLGPRCKAYHDDWYDRVIPALDPDLIVGANQPWDDPQGVRPIQDEDTGPVEVGTLAFRDVVTKRTQESVDALLADGRQVIIIEPVPVAAAANNTLTCLSEAIFFEECEFRTSMAPTSVEKAYREIATGDPDNVFVMDLDRRACPRLPVCEPVINGLIVRWDSAHFTQRFATTLAPLFEAYLEDAGVL